MTRNLHMRLPWLLSSCLMVSGTAMAADPDAPDMPLAASMSAAQQQAVLDYWTPERMASAIPMEAPAVSGTITGSAGGADMLGDVAEPGPAGYAPGWDPNSGLPQPDWDEYVYIEDEVPLGMAEDYDPNIQAAQPAHGAAPSNPLSGPYGPFQRRTHFGRYVNYPRSVIGKLFFSFGSSNYVCSGSVIGRSVVATAGHCNHPGGSGTFATNRLFCPSYNAGGVNSAVGCWTVTNSKTNNLWVSSGDPDRDHACLVTATTGTVKSNRIGDTTGWVGRAWNWGPSQMEEQFGYPQASPFDGKRIVQVSSPEWYEVQFGPTSDPVPSKCTGNDMTGGSSGGPWFLAWNHSSAEYPDTDGTGATDPGQNSSVPWINGVNSHKRCTGGTCNSPPTATAGVFWQEMCSPPFRSTESDVNESEDVFEVCFNIEP